jgi:hypothetical protein
LTRLIEPVKWHKVRGQLFEVHEDEVMMEDDEDGDKKIDALGKLTGCQYRQLSGPTICGI